MLTLTGLPRWLSSEASVCSAGEAGSIPESGRFPGEGNSNPLQYSCLGNLMDRGARQATVYGVLKSWTQLGDETTAKGRDITEHACSFPLSPKPYEN